ncbi:SprT-like domain-containing protein [Aneurinibacillus uraniidurans]|uniref:SprT family zinc-dependent metalloprotease n=1 Tax=Aneurinibacillus uraniidurans TaxID=2966586 RepID=UPI0023491696|nr:SprT-like domain-containing protein [Aneurinibacillus sp. B1]WCN36334.1 sprT domain-containing protein [Aneurinibacillus sp. B1]
MNDIKPTALMMKYLYSLVLEAGEKPDSLLVQLSYEEALEHINRLKRLVTRQTIDTSDHKELAQIGNQLSLTYYGRPCKIPIEWDKSLKNAAGYFMFDPRAHKPLRIIQSMWQYNQFGARHVIATLKHELAHYHLFIEGKPFRDEDAAFKEECRRIGAPLYALAMQEGYETHCSVCGTFTGLEKKNRKKLMSRCCKQALDFGSYVLIFPNGLRVEVQK